MLQADKAIDEEQLKKEAKIIWKRHFSFMSFEFYFKVIRIQMKMYVNMSPDAKKIFLDQQNKLMDITLNNLKRNRKSE